MNNNNNVENSLNKNIMRKYFYVCTRYSTHCVTHIWIIYTHYHVHMEIIYIMRVYTEKLAIKQYA